MGVSRDCDCGEKPLILPLVLSAEEHSGDSDDSDDEDEDMDDIELDELCCDDEECSVDAFSETRGADDDDVAVERLVFSLRFCPFFWDLSFVVFIEDAVGADEVLFLFVDEDVVFGLGERVLLLVVVSAEAQASECLDSSTVVDEARDVDGDVARELAFGDGSLVDDEEFDVRFSSSSSAALDAAAAAFAAWTSASCAASFEFCFWARRR